MTTFVNLTPHALSIRMEDGSIQTIERSGVVARCAQKTEVVTVIGGIKVTKVTLGEVQDLPAPQEGTAYVVSRIIAEAVRDQGRTDIFIPGPALRDDQGRIIGADGLSVI